MFKKIRIDGKVQNWADLGKQKNEPSSDLQEAVIARQGAPESPSAVLKCAL